MTEPREHERSASLSAHATINVGPFATSMLGNAEWQVHEHQYAAGVLLAQAAVEMAAASAFTHLIARKIMTPVDPVLNLVPDLSFMDRRTRALWQWLTGNKITEPQDVWKPYHEHVERRNRIAHGQDWGDANGGQDSIAAARAFIERMAEDLAA